MDLIVSDLNATFIHVQCPDTYRSTLYDHFAYFAKGYRFMYDYKEGIWDGKIRLFDPAYGTLHRHHFDKLVKLCADRGWNIIDNRKFKGHIYTEAQARGFCESLPIADENEKVIEYRDYQFDTVTQCLTNDCATILSPTASGKSLAIYTVTRHALMNLTQKKKILIVVPTKSLVSQMADDFGDYSSTDPSFNEADSVHRITAGAAKNADKPIYISTWQSLMEQPVEYFHQFHTVIVDEVHTAKAKCLSYIVESSVNAYNRFGFTGTLEDVTSDIMVITGLMGPVHRVISTSELIEKGHLAKLHITTLMMKHPEETCRLAAKNKVLYKHEIEYITGNVKRNQFIVKLAQATKGNTLVLFNLVDKHGKPLYEMAKKMVGDGKKVFFISGQIAQEKRQEIIDYMKANSDAILFASYGTFSTGINIKNLDNVIFASPYKSKIKVLQSIGRVLRKATEDAFARLFDFADDLRPINKKTGKPVKYMNHTYKHFLARQQYYQNEDFPVTLKVVNL